MDWIGAAAQSSFRAVVDFPRNSERLKSFTSWSVSAQKASVRICAQFVQIVINNPFQYSSSNDFHLRPYTHTL